MVGEGAMLADRWHERCCLVNLAYCSWPGARSKVRVYTEIDYESSTGSQLYSKLLKRITGQKRCMGMCVR